MLAAIRPEAWNLPLLIHVLGALTLIGAVSLGAMSLGVAWRNGSAASTRLGYRALLWAALPAFVVMRGAAQWIASEEGVEDSDAAWIGIGYMTSEPTFLFLVIATVCAGVGVRRAERDGSSAGLARVATVLVAITLVGYLVAVWAMTTKPL